MKQRKVYTGKMGSSDLERIFRSTKRIEVKRGKFF